MTEKILRKPEVLASIGMGNTWLYEAVRRSDFPQPVKIGERAVGWRKTDVDEWLASLKPIEKRNPSRKAISNAS